jgi:hypothetical protein
VIYPQGFQVRRRRLWRGSTSASSRRLRSLSRKNWMSIAISRSRGFRGNIGNGRRVDSRIAVSSAASAFRSAILDLTIISRAIRSVSVSCRISIYAIGQALRASRKLENGIRRFDPPLCQFTDQRHQAQVDFFADSESVSFSREARRSRRSGSGFGIPRRCAISTSSSSSRASAVTFIRAAARSKRSRISQDSARARSHALEVDRHREREQLRCC